MPLKQARKIFGKAAPVARLIATDERIRGDLLSSGTDGHKAYKRLKRSENPLIELTDKKTSKLLRDSSSSLLKARKRLRKKTRSSRKKWLALSAGVGAIIAWNRRSDTRAKPDR